MLYASPHTDPVSRHSRGHLGPVLSLGTAAATAEDTGRATPHRSRWMDDETLLSTNQPPRQCNRRPSRDPTSGRPDGGTFLPPVAIPGSGSASKLPLATPWGPTRPTESRSLLSSGPTGHVDAVSGTTRSPIDYADPDPLMVPPRVHPRTAPCYCDFFSHFPPSEVYHETYVKYYDDVISRGIQQRDGPSRAMMYQLVAVLPSFLPQVHPRTDGRTDDTLLRLLFLFSQVIAPSSSDPSAGLPTDGHHFVTTSSLVFLQMNVTSCHGAIHCVYHHEIQYNTSSAFPSNRTKLQCDPSFLPQVYPRTNTTL